MVFIQPFSRCRQCLLILLFSMSIRGGLAQPLTSNHLVDSLTMILHNHSKEDSIKVDILATLSVATKTDDVYQSMGYLSEALRITQKINHKNQEAGIRFMLGFSQMQIGESIKSIENFQAILELDEIPQNTRNLALNFIGLNYKAQGDLEKALQYSHEADKYKTDDPRNIILQPYNYGDIYFKKNNIDSALKYGKIAFQNMKMVPPEIKDQFSAEISCLLGNIYIRKNQKDSAHYFINYALESASHHTSDIYLSMNKAISEIESHLSLARWFDKWGSQDSLYFYGVKAYRKAEEVHNYEYMQQSASLLKSAFLNAKKYEQALKFSDLAAAAKDSLQGVDKVRKTQTMHYDYQLKEQQIADLERQLSLKSRIRLLMVFSAFFILFIIFLYRMIYQRKQTIRKLNEQNILIESQKEELNKYLAELKEKQRQLIHAEKMASLGELTAGIAHEIQNPLNFVNNFSDVSIELMDELKNELLIGEEKAALGISADIQLNLIKISHHGKRAEAIVRSMLEHSRTRPGTKTDTDINALIEEYLKLSYHAIRAKDSSYNVNILTELNPNLPLLKVMPADVGRVLLNIFNNAFYSLAEKKQKLSPGYHPTLTVSSSILINNDFSKCIEIAIKDNGIGIDQDILSKIFQPFFTTKPTGTGTGLGLSLSYDIIHMVHGGSISIDSEKGEYCTCIIKLPLD